MESTRHGSKRNNSLTSVNSFASTMKDSAGQRIPREITTQGLFDMDMRFQRVSRSKNTLKKIPSASSVHSAQAQRPLPRSQSFQQGFAQRNLMPQIKKSESLTSITSARRQSVERQHINQYRSTIQLQQQPLPQKKPSRRAQRPQEPFTFPNGEVYIPRNKQRNSQTHLSSMVNDSQNSVPLMAASSSEPLPALAITAPSIPSPGIATTATPSMDQHTVSLNAEPTNSSSPSPSRASRTNSSVTESTPPSSIDDFTTLQMTTSSTAIVKSQEKNSDTLQKIEESVSNVDDELAESKPIAKARVPSPPQVQLPKRNEISVTRPTRQAEAVKQKNVTLERKPSAIKRFFSKMFSSKKKTSPAQKEVKQKQTSTPTLVPKPTPTPRPTPVERKQSRESLQLSFAEDDEDNGINVVGSKSLLPSSSEDSNDYNSGAILDSMFSKFSESETKLTYEELKEDQNQEDSNQSMVLPKVRKSSPSPEDEDFVMTFDDLEYVEKITEYGETSFPDLRASDLGQSHRKMMRSKSIERKKSIRSISSSSKLSVQSPISDHIPIKPPSPMKAPLGPDDDEDVELEYINDNRRKSPSPLRPSHSIMKTTTHTTPTPAATPKKSVGFTKSITVSTTHAMESYNRHSVAVSNLQWSPPKIQRIRMEFNEFKRHMPVHPDSVSNTHFYRA